MKRKNFAIDQHIANSDKINRRETKFKRNQFKDKGRVAAFEELLIHKYIGSDQKQPSHDCLSFLVEI